MPEGFSSIADLRVSITANAEELKGGLEAARNIVQRFASDGNSSLRGFDAMLGKLGGGVGAFVVKLTTIGKALEAVNQIVATLDIAAKQLGVKDEFNEVKDSANDLTQSLIDGLGTGMNYVASQAAGVAQNFVEYNTIVGTYTTPKTKELNDYLKEAAEWFSNLAYQVRVAMPASAQSVDTLTRSLKEMRDKIKDNAEEIEHLRGSMDMGVDAGAPEQIRSLERQNELLRQEIMLKQMLLPIQAEIEMRDLDRKAGKFLEDKGKDLEQTLRMVAAKEHEAATLGMTATQIGLYNLQLAMKADLQKKGIAEDEVAERVLERAEEQYSRAAAKVEAFNKAKRLADAEKGFFERLDEQIAGLKDQTTALLMGAEAGAQYVAVERMRRELVRLGLADNPAVMKAFKEEIALLQERGALLKQQQEAQRQDRSAENTINGMDRELLQLQQRRTALTETAGETARIAAEERALLQIRQQGRAATDAERAAIEAKSRAIGEEVQKTVELQTQLRDLQAYGTAVTRALDNAFRQWTRDSTLSVKEMVSSMLADIAQLGWQQSISKPLGEFLFGGGQTQGGGFFGQLLGLSGTRADGGPVEAGKRYLVGERGPEMFVPGMDGVIMPNGAGGGGVNVVINMPINAQGAYPESIADIRREIAGIEARVPSKVLEGIKEARERGF